MQNAGGYSIIISPGERNVEHDLEKCAHCQAVQFVKAGWGGPTQVMICRADGSHYFKEVNRCSKCWQLICPKAECNKECMPYLKKIEIEERAARFSCD